MVTTIIDLQSFVNMQMVVNVDSVSCMVFSVDSIKERVYKILVRIQVEAPSFGSYFKQMTDSIIETAVNLTEAERKTADIKYPGPTEFVHLHNHSLFSTLDGIATPEEYFSACAELGHPAFSITDHGSMAGIPDAYWSAKKHKVKFLAGCEIYFNPYHEEFLEQQSNPDWKIGALKIPKTATVVDFDMMVKHEEWAKYRRNRHLTVISMNMHGYRNLIHMTSKAWEIGFYYKPRIWFDQIKKYHEGLIILSGCLNGPICHALRQAAKWNRIASGKMTVDKMGRRLNIGRVDATSKFKSWLKEAEMWVHKFRDLMGDRFYLELQMPGGSIPFGKEAFGLICKLSKKHNIKMVVSNDCLEVGFPILMADGTFKAIGLVEIGDFVMTHKGRARKVIAKKIRKLKQNEKCLKIKNIPWSMTENHPIYIKNINREQTRAKEKPNVATLAKVKFGIDGSVLEYANMEVPIEWENSDYSGLVCDIEVEEDHTFIMWGNVISHNCHFLSRKDFKVQKCMMAVGQGLQLNDPNLFHVDSDEQFFKSRSQLRQTFFEGEYDKYITAEEFEECLQNTVELSKRCETFDPDLSPKLPAIPEAESKLARLVAQALVDTKLAWSKKKYLVDGKMVTHKQQANIELKRYCEKGFASYFLIIKDLIDYSKSNDWDVGPGRGSAGGSLVCFLLGIHSLDPLKWGLSSVRFMGDSRGGNLLKVTMD